MLTITSNPSTKPLNHLNRPQTDFSQPPMKSDDSEELRLSWPKKKTIPFDYLSTIPSKSLRVTNRSPILISATPSNHFESFIVYHLLFFIVYVPERIVLCRSSGTCCPSCVLKQIHWQSSTTQTCRLELWLDCRQTTCKSYGFCTRKFASGTEIDKKQNIERNSFIVDISVSGDD